MSTTSTFKGVFTAIVTPFAPDGSVDWKAYDLLVQRQIKGGVTGIVPCGTTGESPTLTKEEKSELIRRAVDLCRGKALVMAGTGSNNTAETVAFSKEACALGADGLLLVVPYYNKPSQAGLVAHFTAIADAVNKPCFLYNVPGRTITSLAATTVATLSKHPRIAGIKEATGNLAVLTEIRIEVARQNPSKDFIYLTGDDPTLVPFLAAGGHGVISVASNIIPKTIVDICKNKSLKDFETVFSFLNALFIEANPVPCKAVLSWGDHCTAQLRLPLVGLAPENETKLRAVWDALPAALREELNS